MVTRCRQLVLVAIVLGSFGCRDIDTVIPKDESKWETDLKPVVSKLSDDDKHLFTGYVARMKLASALAGGAGIPDGTTIAKAIGEQKAWLEARKAKEGEEEALKAKVDAERQATIAALSESVTMVLQSWRHTPPDIHNHRFDDTFDVVVAIQNKSAKGIKGVQGELTLKDTFGDVITKIRFRVEENIAPGATFVWNGSKELNQFNPEDKRLMNLVDGKFTSKAVPTGLVFADGATVKAPEDP